MNIKRHYNTKERGVIEFVYYRESGRYVGVCLTFDIVEEGKDLNQLRQSVEDAAKLHLRTVMQKNLSNDLLNRYAPKPYWKKYFEALKSLEKQKVEEKKLSSELPAIVNYPFIGANQFTAVGA